MEYVFTYSFLELLTGATVTINVGEEWETTEGGIIQILWIRLDSEFPIQSTKGNFYRIENLERIVSLSPVLVS